MDCEQAKELAASYVLSLLSEEERKDFEATLPNCPETEQLVRRYSSIVGVMPLAVEEHIPSATLKTRILRAAEERLPAQTPSAPQALSRFPWLTAATRFATGKVSLTAVAAALLLAVISLAFWSGQLHSSNRDQARQITRLQESVRILSVQGTSAAPAASGRLIYIADQGMTVLIVNGLAPLSSDKTYQIWLIRNSTPVSAGLFRIAEGGEGLTFVVGDIRQYQVLAVTMEPAGGMLQPTGQILLKTEL